MSIFDGFLFSIGFWMGTGLLAFVAWQTVFRRGERDETERRDTINKVPWLGDIPGIGFLFRSTNTVSNKAELLIFVTPRILEEGSSIY